MQAIRKSDQATSPYLNETPRDLKDAIQDATEQAIRDLRAQVIWRANLMKKGAGAL